MFSYFFSFIFVPCVVGPLFHCSFHVLEEQDSDTEEEIRREQEERLKKLKDLVGKDL